jgi:methylated-DNA-protein-cysteine methyltransferase-like protein
MSTDPLPPKFVPWDSDHRLTSFQQAVVRAVRALSRGELATYADIADEAGRPGSAQAVANVLRAAPELSWWRVIPSDGRLYRTHAVIQGRLLEREGHHIDEDRRVRARPGRLSSGCGGTPAAC